MGVSAAIIGVTLAAGAYTAYEQKEARKDQARAQEKANEIEQRRSQISNQRERAKAAAQTQMLVAQNQAAAAGQGYSFSSSLAGSNIGLQSQLSSAIGYQNTLLASNALRADVIQQGENRAARHLNRAAWGSVVQQGASSASSFGWGRE